LFDIEFITIIDIKYYFKCWREETKIILYKSSKDKIIFKEYQITTLLNCLIKIVEKIIITRIVYLVENSLYGKDILNYEQIEDRK